MVRSLDAAAAFVERVGIATVFPSADLVLPSLWEAVAGTSEVDWSVRDDAGGFVSFSPEFDRVWRWKDELPARRLAFAGKHLGRFVALLSADALREVYALREEPELGPLQQEIVAAVREQGPCSGPELRLLLGTSERKKVAAAIDSLQRQLVLTNAGVVEQEQGWPAVRVDLLERRFRSGRLPAPEQARAQLARRVLDAAGEASAADVSAALGWRVKQAAAVLESLAEPSHKEDGIAIWVAHRARRPSA
jgi:hypothetical protein